MLVFFITIVITNGMGLEHVSKFVQTSTSWTDAASGPALVIPHDLEDMISKSQITGARYDYQC
jgi:hypothetical protein